MRNLHEASSIIWEMRTPQDSFPPSPTIAFDLEISSE
jgi:hypothetical protein